MEASIYLHYTKEQLDRNFDQRTWVDNAEEVIVRCVAKSRQTRERLRHRASIPYGQTDRETFDLFPVAQSGAPLLIFVHGGAWRAFSKDDFSYVAEPYVAAGINTAVLDFANLPSVRLPEMIAQVRRGIEWIYRNANDLRIDRNRIHVAAHSSGSHLTANALLTDWTSRQLPDDIIKTATCLSGPYELEPVMLSKRSVYVELNTEEVDLLSPLRHAAKIKRPVTIAYAERDTDEFRRQSIEFAAALDRTGVLTQTIFLPSLNHFEGMESYGASDGQLTLAVLSQIAQ